MILDDQELYSDDQAISGVGPEVSEDHINHGGARQLGVGEPLWIVVMVTTVLVGAGATVQVDIQTDDNTGFSSPTTTRTIGTFAAAAAVGSKIEHRLGVDDINEQFSRLQYTYGAALTSGALTAGITHDIDAFTAYARGYTVS